MGWTGQAAHECTITVVVVVIAVFLTEMLEDLVKDIKTKTELETNRK